MVLSVQIADIRVKLNVLRDELETAVKNQDFTQAAAMKQEITELEESKMNLLNEIQPQSQEVRTEKVTIM